MITTLITGASSDIGLELAKQFAAVRDGIVLTARSEDKLDELAKEFQQSQKVTVTVIKSELSKPDEGERLYDCRHDRGIESDTVVNKAGYQGHRKNANLVIPEWKNRLMLTDIGSLPRFATCKITGKMEGI